MEHSLLVRHVLIVIVSFALNFLSFLLAIKLFQKFTQAYYESKTDLTFSFSLENKLLFAGI